MNKENPMRVRITKPSHPLNWYVECIGVIFEVEPTPGFNGECLAYTVVRDYPKWFKKPYPRGLGICVNDCEVVEVAETCKEKCQCKMLRSHSKSRRVQRRKRRV